MEKVTDWRIVFNQVTSPDPPGSYEVDGRMDTGELGDVLEYEGNYMAAAKMDKPIEMELAQAYKLLREHGVEDGFQWVRLVQHLSEEHVHYRFCYDEAGRTGWKVNVETRAVTTIEEGDAPPPLPQRPR